MNNFSIEKSFDRFCCFHRQYKDVIGGDIDSFEQLYNATKICFYHLNITYVQHLTILWDVVNSRNDFQNYKEDDCFLTSPSHIGYMCFWLILLIVTILSNFTVIIAVNKVSYLKENVGNFFILSLAVTDFLVGLLIIPIKIRFTYNNLNFRSSFLCRVYVTTDNALFSTSVTTLFLISVDRYLALSYPYKYQRWLTMVRCKILIGGIWIYGLMWGSLGNVNWHNFKLPAIVVNKYENCVINENNSYVTIVYLFVFYTPAIIMGIIYTRVLSIARYHARSISLSIPIQDIPMVKCPMATTQESTTGVREMTPANESEYCKNESNEKKQLTPRASRYSNVRSLKYRKMTFKASKTVAVVYGTFFLCWFPVSIFSLAEAYGQHLFSGYEAEMKWLYHVFVEVLPVLNSMMNPFIYAIMNKQYRRAYKVILSKLNIFGEKVPFGKQRKTGTITSVTTLTRHDGCNSQIYSKCL